MRMRDNCPWHQAPATALRPSFHSPILSKIYEIHIPDTSMESMKLVCCVCVWASAVVATMPETGRCDVDDVRVDEESWQRYGRLCASQGRHTTTSRTSSIQRIEYDGTPLATFLRAVAANSDQPAVLVGIPQVAEAAERWTDDGYVASVAPELHRVLELPQRWYVYRDDGLQLSGYDDGRVERKEAMPTANLIKHANKQAAAGPQQMLPPPYYYYARGLADADCTQIRAELPWIQQLQDGLDNRDGFQVSKHTQLWLAQPGVATHTHYDVFNNFYMQLKGTKQFFLSPPSARQRLQAFPGTHQQARQSQLNFSCSGSTEDEDLQTPDEHSNAGAGTLAGRTAAEEAVLKAGEVLFIPAYTFHQVHPLSFSGSINIFTSTGFSAIFRGLREAGIPTALQTLDRSIEGSRHRVAVLAVLVRSVLRLGNVLDTAPCASNSHDSINAGTGIPETHGDEGDCTGVRQFLLDEMEHRYKELAPAAGGCPLSVEERERCPKQAVLSEQDAAEIEAVAVAVSTALPSTRGGGTTTQNGSNGNGSSNNRNTDTRYHTSVVKLLVADYIEDLAAGVLGGAHRVCLFLKCLASHGSWTHDAQMNFT